MASNIIAFKYATDSVHSTQHTKSEFEVFLYAQNIFTPFFITGRIFEAYGKDVWHRIFEVLFLSD